MQGKSSLKTQQAWECVCGVLIYQFEFRYHKFWKYIFIYGYDYGNSISYTYCHKQCQAHIVTPSYDVL